MIDVSLTLAFKLAQEIYAIHKTVKHSHKQCRILIDRA